MLRRLILGFGANALGQVINIVIQVSSLPLFLLFWDASTFGTWLVLSALPGYLSMADVGIVSVAGNKMTMALGRDDIREADAIYHSAQLFLTIVCCGLAAVLTPAALLWPTSLWPSSISATMDTRVALAALLGSVLVAIFGGLADAVFKATGRYPLGTVVGQLARLAEWVGYMVGLIVFRSFAGVAIVGLLARVVAVGLGMLVAQRGQSSLTLGFRHAQRIELRRMLHPAISFMAFPLANALSFQGITILVFFLAGPAAVALFNAYRTIARIAVQLTSMFSLALWPEFARLFGQAGMKAVHPLFKQSALLGAAVAGLFSPVLFVVSPWLLAIWTHGRIPFEPTLMALLLAYAAVGGFWHVPRVLLMATNKHIGLSGWSLTAGVLSIALAWALGQAWQVNGVGVAMLLSEVFIAAICVHLANRSFVEAH